MSNWTILHIFHSVTHWPTSWSHTATLNSRMESERETQREWKMEGGRERLKWWRWGCRERETDERERKIKKVSGNLCHRISFIFFPYAAEPCEAGKHAGRVRQEPPGSSSITYCDNWQAPLWFPLGCVKPIKTQRCALPFNYRRGEASNRFSVRQVFKEIILQPWMANSQTCVRVRVNDTAQTSGK